ncbi:hypothetical protein [Nocardia sp. NPDC051832]|uniref:hypothetical protein n=1 Tax=Nocardia sp. NPDC051832 TaxID=3155673 RepID=UPI0034166451
MATTDYGQAEIAAFSSAITSAGHVKFDEAAVREVVRLYDVIIAQLTTQQREILKATQTEGFFGTLRSGQELASGFSNKAQEAYDTCSQFLQGIMRLQETYLRAAGLYEDADQKNAAAVRIATESMNNGQ